MNRDGFKRVVVIGLIVFLLAALIVPAILATANGAQVSALPRLEQVAGMTVAA